MSSFEEWTRKVPEKPTVEEIERRWMHVGDTPLYDAKFSNDPVVWEAIANAATDVAFLLENRRKLVGEIQRLERSRKDLRRNIQQLRENPLLKVQQRIRNLESAKDHLVRYVRQSIHYPGCEGHGAGEDEVFDCSCVKAERE